MAQWRFWVGVAVSAFSATAFSKNHFLVLSGGDSPASNHYSQYLQAKTLTFGLRDAFGDDHVDVRFGAGNSDEHPRLLGDVHRLTDVDSMVFGVLPGNGTATKSGVNAYFESLRAGEYDDFFLLVGDHGMPNPADTTTPKHFNNNCVNLWNYQPATESVGQPQAACLSKDELRNLLTSKVRAERRIFAMSQCYSGGFHQMSVTEVKGYPQADPNLCGFTATTEDTTASGCTPDADGKNYRGYERFLAQRLTGKDVVTGAPMTYAASGNLHDAHIAASLDDTTKDIPLSTSDYFLLRWADKIREKGFVPRSSNLGAAAARALYQDIADRKTSPAEMVGLAGDLGGFVVEKNDLLEKTLAVLRPLEPALADLMAHGTESDLAGQVTAFNQEDEHLEAALSLMGDQWSAEWFREVSSRWFAALKQGPIPGLSEPERNQFELGFLAVTEQKLAGKEGIDSYALRHLATLTTTQPALASEFAHYLKRRMAVIDGWIAVTADAELKARYARLKATSTEMQAEWARAMKASEQRDHLRRVLFLRRTIAAAILLRQMEDETALSQLTGLLACERSPFRD